MSTRRAASSTPPAGSTPAFGHRNLPLLLLQARESVISRFRPVLNAHGVTEQQWRIVRALHEQGAMEPRQIVTRCHISSPSLAGVLARMDELGLVQRQRLAHDQRRVMVTLTTSSRALVLAMAPQVEALYQAIEAHIGAEFIGGFYAALDELIGLMDALPPLHPADAGRPGSSAQ